MKPLPGRFCALALVAAASGCKSDQGLGELHFDNVAVATGDFDRVEEALDRNGVTNTLYEGYIFQPVYADEVDSELYALTTETLFTGTNAEGDPEIFTFDAAFVNSGTRGFGEYVYNDVTPDDSLVSDPVVIDNVRDFAERKRTVVASDWAYDLVEATWPDAVAFLNEDEGLDAAQVGASDTVVADVTDDRLVEALGADQLEVVFDFSYWAVMESASAEAEVYLRGDVRYRQGGGEGFSTVEDVPLLVAFSAGSGRVVFSSFAWRAQKSPVTDAILATLIDGFRQGAVSTGETGDE